MASRGRVGAGEDEAPLGDVRQGAPHLLAGDHPLVAVGLGPGADAGEVGARVGLAVALAPVLGWRRRSRGRTAPVARGFRRRGASGPSRVAPTLPRRAGARDAGELLVEGRPARRGWPGVHRDRRVAETDPAAARQLPLPGELHLEREVLTADPAVAASTARTRRRGGRRSSRGPRGGTRLPWSWNLQTPEYGPTGPSGTVRRADSTGPRTGRGASPGSLGPRVRPRVLRSRPPLLR